MIIDEFLSSFLNTQKTKITMKKRFLIILVLFIFASFGCTEMSRSEKNLCYSLTTRSYDYIPICLTEESCYKEIDSLFQTDLSYAQETKLYELKNKIARSWFYYNKAIIEMKNISKMCQNGSALSLPGSINQMQFYLEKSFLELDQGIKNSFEIINYQEKLFTVEQIELLKEEGAYSSLIELRQIISELESGKTNSDSYVSYYMEMVENFNNSNPNYTKPLVEKQPFWFLLYNTIENKILKTESKEQLGFFPFLTDYFRQTISYLEFRFYAEQSITALQSFPASEFMSLYSKLGGKENSALQRFADLINRTSKNYEKLVEEKEILLSKTQESIIKSQAEYAKLSEDELIIFLKGELSPGKITSKKDYQQRIISLKERQINLNEEINSEKISLGKTIKTLKEIKNEANELTKEFLEINLEEKEKVETLCENEAKKIKKQVEEQTGLEQLVSELNYLCSKTISEKELKLKYCKKMIEKNKEYEIGKKNIAELEAKKIDLTGECFAYLDNIFKYYKFYELELLYSELKKEIVTEENIFFFHEACKKIKSQVNNEISSQSEIKKAIENFETLKKIIDDAEINKLYFKSKTFSEELEKLTELKNNFDEFFSEGIKYNKILPIVNEINQKMEDAISGFNKIYESEIIKYVEKNVKINLIDSKVPIAGKQNTITKRIILENPFIGLERVCSIELGFSGTLQKSDAPIINFEEETLNLKRIPMGITVAEISSEELITIEEKTKIILATNETSLIEKMLSFGTKTNFPKILIELKKPVGLEKINIFKNNKELANTVNDQNIIIVTPLKENEQITVYYYINGLISLEKILLSSKVYSNGKKEQYKFVAKNNFEEALTGTIIFPVEDGQALKDIVVYDEKNTRIKEALINGRIAIQNQSFLPKETKTYYVDIEISDIITYYTGMLHKRKLILEEYKEYTLSKEITDFLLKVPESGFEKEALSLIKKADLRISELKEERNSGLSKESIKKQLENKISKIEQTITNLTEYGLLNLDEVKTILNESKLALESNIEKEILKALATVNTLTYKIDDRIKEQNNELWKYINESTITSLEIEEIKKAFFEKKEFIDGQLAHNPNEAYKANEKLQKLYASFLEKEKEINNNKSLVEDETKKQIKNLKLKSLELITYLKKELSIEEDKLLKAKFIPPITNTRLQKLEIELKSLNTNSTDSLMEVEKIYHELTESVDYLKLQTIKKYNSAIDATFPPSQMEKAKALIDNNDFVSAYLVLGDKKSKDEKNYLVIIPILVIVVFGVLLKKKINKKSKENKEKEKHVSQSWE